MASVPRDDLTLAREQEVAVLRDRCTRLLPFGAETSLIFPFFGRPMQLNHSAAG